MRLSLRDVYAALDYGLAGGETTVFTGVSTDTRTLQPGDLFVALMGPQTDGHQHVAAALRAGATGLIVSQNVVASLSTPVLRVPDTQVAYGLLARHFRDCFDIPVIGVTGSVGKTTVKEMLASALSPLGPVLKTAASQNNETGVPRALLELDSEHKAAVIEMGMRGAGQIAYLCGIARPTIGVLTVIADNHLELLGSMDAIADAKGELLESLPPDGLAVLNAADPYRPYLQFKTAARVLIYGGAEAITQTPNGWKFTVRGVPVEIASVSRHDISNALAALTVAEALGVSLEAAAEALQAYTPPPMRMNIVKTGWGGTILNDAYNAGPASVATALQTLAAYNGIRKIAFLGDMRELGTRAEEAHRELGPVIAGLGGLDALYTVGGLAALIPNAAQRFSDSAEAAQFVREALKLTSGDVVLVKGSRAIAMEKVRLGFGELRMTRLDPYALAGFLTAFLISVLLGPKTIDFLRVLKFGQNINEHVPGHQAKQGTPTMGGLLFVLSLLLTLGIGLAAAPPLRPISPQLAAVVLVFIAHAGLGFLDDFLKARRGKSLGLLARQKLAGQVVIALLFVGWLYLTAQPNFTTEVWFWHQAHLDFGYAYYVLAFFLLIGMSNAANLTDGLDGLAGGLSVFTLLGLALTTHPNFGQLPEFGFTLAGACLGFLWYNAHPAKVFMGDTGSLALGSQLRGNGDSRQTGSAAAAVRCCLLNGNVQCDDPGERVQSHGWQAEWPARVQDDPHPSSF